MLGPPWGPRGCLWRRGAAGADSHVQGLGLGAVVHTRGIMPSHASLLGGTPQPLPWGLGQCVDAGSVHMTDLMLPLF